MQYLTLNNGVIMPVLGFGVCQIPPEKTKQAVLDAIDVGYRLIDTAQSYLNESEVGQAIAECGVPREELFITTKVWIENYSYDKCRTSVLQSLEKLELDYIDLVLLHQPFSDYYGAYRALEDLYEEGLIRAIGVSNFLPDRLTDICFFERKVIPAVNQVEANPFNAQYVAQANMEKNGVQMAAWAPFGEGRQGMFTNETLVKIGEKQGKTSAQVILRWLIDRSIVVLCKTTHKERMAENIDVFDFALDEDDMLDIMKLDRAESLFFDYRNPETVERFDEMVEIRKI
ncbi:aldo/keto reductase [uncultured Methanobrevibacter sp.]|uniref:aldo/keto reductase n=1 Tax=uncultured Methanobrevibacter sp. TaxID=253161 RepID=UPI0025ED1265|nr:aldo/keto reductase [uncultured Methanobrevibacter sp.]